MHRLDDNLFAVALAAVVPKPSEQRSSATMRTKTKEVLISQICNKEYKGKKEALISQTCP